MSSKTPLPLPTSSSGNEASQGRDADSRWREALLSYKEETGHDLLEQSFAQDLLSQSSTDEVMARLKSFMAFRARGHKILGVLKPIVSVVLRCIHSGSDGASVRIQLLRRLDCYLTIC